MMKFSELEVVKVLRNFDEGIKKGTIGTVVHIFSNPSEAYQVEFCDIEGSALAEITILPEDLEKYKN